MSKEELKRRIRLYDTKIWEDNLARKSTMKYYMEGKARIGYDFCYRNNASSMFLARARTNSLKLEEAVGRGNLNYNTKCKLCELAEENIVHFTVECIALEGRRNYNLIDRNIKDPKKRMIKLLFNQGNYQEVGKMIRSLWLRRKAILKYLREEERDKRSNRPVISGTSRTDPGPMGNSHTPLRRSRGSSAIRG